tara:strand:+ start:20214 stop:20852 length:639 start_codon:yes stop_codon:yes gene_type:complete
MDLSKIDNDFNDKEVETINTFVSNGCIGLETVVKDEAKVNSLFSLYMNGKTYVEISKIARVKKDIVLYMSAKMGWYENRMEYLTDIQSKTMRKMSETRVESLNFITSLIGFHHKFYGDEIDKYIATGDRDIIANLDLKALGQYFKSIEILEKMMNPSNVNPNGKGSGATINIHAAGAKLEQTDDNTLEITAGKTGDLLKALAEIKDKQDKTD